MPINLHTSEIYSFPFETLFSMLLSIPGNDARTIKHWEALFSHFNDCSIDEYNTYINNYGLNYHEYFQFMKNYVSLESYYVFHFDVGKILSVIDRKPCIILRKKLEKIACFDYSTDGYISNKPVILCPFYADNKNLIVIDGNHSLSNSKDKHKFFIRYLIRIPGKNDFIFTIDYAMYILNNFLMEHPNISSNDYSLFDFLTTSDSE